MFARIFPSFMIDEQDIVFRKFSFSLNFDRFAETLLAGCCFCWAHTAVSPCLMLKWEKGGLTAIVLAIYASLTLFVLSQCYVVFPYAITVSGF